MPFCWQNIRIDENLQLKHMAFVVNLCMDAIFHHGSTYRVIVLATLTLEKKNKMLRNRSVWC